MKNQEFNEDYLAHYGVKGMKWGVRNEETRRKYGQGPSRVRVKLSKTAKRFGKGLARGYKVVRKQAKAVAKENAKILDAKLKNAVEINKLKRLAKTDRAFDKLRKETLASTDPAVIEKGLATLTSAEVKEKMARIKLERPIREAANKAKQEKIALSIQEETAKKAKKERKAAGIGGQAIKGALSSTLTNAGQGLLRSVGFPIDKPNNTAERQAMIGALGFGKTGKHAKTK